MTQPNLDAMPADQLALAVVGATRECPECRGEGETHYPDDKESRQTCAGCLGTGRRFVFSDETGVRLGCRGWPVHPDLLENGESYCTKDTECLCHGLSYTATDRLEVLLKAALYLVNNRRGHETIWGRIGFWQSAGGGSWACVFGDLPPGQERFPVDFDFTWGTTPIDALYQALAEALVAQGYELGPTHG